MRTPATTALPASTMTPSPVVTLQMLRQMMAQAAAKASTVAGDLSTPASSEHFEPTFRRPPGPASQRYARRLINQLPPAAANFTPKGAPLPPVEDGVRMKRVQEVANDIKKTYKHPIDAAQVETDVLHHIRAILYMNRTVITQSFVSHVAGVSQGSLSHYVRGLFKGNQDNVDQRLARFVELFVSGALDPYIDEIRAGIRSAARPLYFSPANTTLTPAASTPTVLTPPPTTIDNLNIPLPVPPPPPPQLQPAPWTHHTPTPEVDQAFSSEHATPTKSSVEIEADSLSTIIPTDIEPEKVPDSSIDEHTDTIARKLYMPPSNLVPHAVPDMVTSNMRADVANAPPIVDFSSDRLIRPRKRRRTVPVPFVIKPTPPKPAPLKFPELPEEIENINHTTAIDNAFHTLISSEWSMDSDLTKPLLLLIELNVELDGNLLHTYIQWEVNERKISPELAADLIRLRLGFSTSFAHPIAMQIRRALFNAGVICPPPPTLEPVENRRLIRFSLQIDEGDKKREICDECEWDLSAGGLNSPELFARQFCIDEKLPQRFAINVSQAIREKLVVAHAISYGDEETQQLASKMVSEDDPLRWQLRVIKSSLVKLLPEEERAKEREEHEAAINSVIVLPILDAVVFESRKRKEAKLLREYEMRTECDFKHFKGRITSVIAQRNEHIEKGVQKAEEEAEKIYEERNLDFRPYLGLTVARDEKPSVWMVPAFDRRRRKQLTFPMVSGKNTGKHGSASRSSKRRKSFRPSEKGVAQSIKSISTKTRGVIDPEVSGIDADPSDDVSMAAARSKPFSIPLRLFLKRPT